MTKLLRPEPVVVLTDYDLDGACSSIFLDYCYNVAARKSQGLAKTHAAAQQLRAEYTNINTLVIADIPIEPDTMKWALENYDHVVLYDHHERTAKYAELAEKIPERLTVYFSLDFCSATLVYRSYIVDGGNEQIPELNELAAGVQAFDLWQSSSPYFERGCRMNDMFWNLHMQGFRPRFKDGFDGFTAQEDAISAAKDKSRRETVENAMVEKLDSGSQIVGIDDAEAVNFVPLYMEGDVFYVLYPNVGTGKIHLSCRTKDKIPAVNFNTALEELLDCPETKEVVVRGGGHANAAGVQFVEGLQPAEMATWIAEALDERVRHW